ncbi:MAG: tetratricopeptide repeat protein [Candidatus Solibacter sp.]|jgi:cytochrome c-type biogenesis protein CcmH/NrfG
MKIKHGDRVKRLISIFAFLALAWAAGPDLDRAHKLYNLTEFQQSLEVLQAVPNKDAAVYELMGRDYYGQGEFHKATEALEKAVALQPGNSEMNLWLGRAYGRRAETSSLITAPGFANKARQFFEKAAQLNPSNIEAQSDLFEYYLEAPGFLGGGFDKASATALQIARISPAEGHWAQAKLAEKRKEYSSAETQLRRAAEIAPQQIGRLIDLARLFTEQGRYQDADLSLAKAEQIAPHSAKLMFAKADLYIKSKRNLAVARELLKQYLSSALTPDDPPRADAEKLLKQVQGS